MRPLIALGLLALPAALALAAAPGTPACTSGRVMGIRPDQFLLATGMDDTVRTGPGPIAYTGLDDDDRAALATVHGQVFRMDRAGGDLPADVLGAAAGTEVILVPYGTQCSDLWRWTESARWTPPGAQRFAPVRLWARDQWIGGRPTFDVAADHDSYPVPSLRRGPDSAEDDGDPRPDSLRADEGLEREPEYMTAAEVFEMEFHLPTWEEAEAAPFAAYQPFVRWAEAHPHLLTHYPALHAMETANHALQPCVPAHAVHPVAGTYRMTVVLDGRDTVTAVLRTDSHGYPLCSPAPFPRGLTAVRPRMADTARLYATQAVAPAGLEEPQGRAAPTGNCGNVALDVPSTADRDRDGRRTWRADLDFSLTNCAPAVPGAARIYAVNAAAYEARDPANVPGVFREAPDGGMTFRQTWRLNGRLVMEAMMTRTDRRTTR